MKAKTKFTRLWSILLVLVMVVGMIPIAALAEEPDAAQQFADAPGEYFYNNSGNNDSEGPTEDTTFTLTEPTMITGIWTYHWYAANYDIDFSRQTIQLKDTATNTVVYSGAVRVGHIWNVRNCDWIVLPNIVLPVGTYQVIDSHNESWCALNSKGVCMVKGYSTAPSATADFTSGDGSAALALLNAAKTGTEDSTWDPDTNTLTLNGVNFTTTASTAVKLPEAAIIVLNGDNTITSGEAMSQDSFGIYALGDLTIKGAGKLTVTSGTANDDSQGIYAKESIDISDNADVIATSGTANDSCYGIHAGDSIDISGNVTAIGGEAGEYSHGIHAVNNLTIEGGNVTAAGGTAMNANSYGIYSYYDIKISGGTVIATGGAADSYSLGIYASKNVFVSGTADVTAEGGSAAENDSNGICAGYYVTITGGSVKATGGTANSLSVGISADNDAVTISGDNTVVTATGGTATKDSYGIYSNGDTKISGGTTRVTATGGTVNATGGTAGSGYDSCGICADDNVIIEDGIVSAKGGKATDDSFGIYANTGLTISGTAKVKATGGTAAVRSYGIYASTGLTISGDNTVVTATGGTASKSKGIFVNSNYVTILSGQVEATGGKATNDISFGIDSSFMAIRGGTVTAKGGEATSANGYSYGISSLYDIEIYDGTVTAEGGKATNGSYGIDSDGNTYISGGTVTAKAGAAQTASALSKKPKALPATYWWRSSDSGQYKKGSFNWSDVSTYVEIGDTEPITTYTVTFDANGGTGTMADVSGVLGDYTLPANGFTAPEGKQFKCWSVGGTEKAVGDKITVSTNTTVKAVWEDIEYTVTVTNGTASVSKAAAGATVTLTADAAPTGQVFDKWVVESGNVTLADATSATTTFTMPAGNVTAKATYKNIPVVTYTVTFEANGGSGSMAAVTGVLGDYTLPANGFTAPEGKQFKCWSVGGTEKAARDKIAVTADTTVKAVWENIPAAPIEYEILDGANSSWTHDSDGNLSIRGNGAFSEFVGVRVDGKSVDEKYYTVKEGSTIVTLKAGYLNTLTVGSHTLEIIWTDGSASTAFTVNAKAVVDNDTKSPQTGDNSSIAFWIALLFVSAAGVLGTTIYIRKKKYSVK